MRGGILSLVWFGIHTERSNMSFFQRLITPLLIEINVRNINGRGQGDYYTVYIFGIRVAMIRAWGLK